MTSKQNLEKTVVETPIKKARFAQLSELELNNLVEKSTASPTKVSNEVSSEHF